MTAILLMGFLIGMRHALESDHIAAVAILVNRSRNLRQAAPLGMMWGLGHTLTLFIFGGLVLGLDTVLSEGLAKTLETAVGVMLVVLGGDVIFRLIKERIHFHSHRHHGEKGARDIHFHAHSHAGETRHSESTHQHQHPDKMSSRALIVGMMHGMAGSAALVLLTLQTVESVVTGVFYILLFGLGSTLGMGVLSVVIAMPLRYAAESMTWAYRSLTAALGAFSVGLGLLTIYHGVWA